MSLVILSRLPSRKGAVTTKKRRSSFRKPGKRKAPYEIEETINVSPNFVRCLVVFYQSLRIKDPAPLARLKVVYLVFHDLCFESLGSIIRLCLYMTLVDNGKLSSFAIFHSLHRPSKNIFSILKCLVSIKSENLHLGHLTSRMTFLVP